MKTTASARRAPSLSPNQRHIQPSHMKLSATWELYELRKRALQGQGLSQQEYELAVRRLADELGV